MSNRQSEETRHPRKVGQQTCSKYLVKQESVRGSIVGECGSNLLSREEIKRLAPNYRGKPENFDIEKAASKRRGKSNEGEVGKQNKHKTKTQNRTPDSPIVMQRQEIVYHTCDGNIFSKQELACIAPRFFGPIHEFSMLEYQQTCTAEIQRHERIRMLDGKVRQLRVSSETQGGDCILCKTEGEPFFHDVSMTCKVQISEEIQLIECDAGLSAKDKIALRDWITRDGELQERASTEFQQVRGDKICSKRFHFEEHVMKVRTSLGKVKHNVIIYAPNGYGIDNFLFDMALRGVFLFDGRDKTDIEIKKMLNVSSVCTNRISCIKDDTYAIIILPVNLEIFSLRSGIPDMDVVCEYDEILQRFVNSYTKRKIICRTDVQILRDVFEDNYIASWIDMPAYYIRKDSRFHLDQKLVSMSGNVFEVKSIRK